MRYLITLVVLIFSQYIAVANNPTLLINNSSSKPHEMVDVPILVSDLNDIAGFQFDLVVPTSLEYDKVVFDDMLTDWQVSVTKLNDNKLRVFAANLESGVLNFIGNKQILVLTFLTKPISENVNWTISELIFSDSQSEPITVTLSLGSHKTLAPKLHIPQREFDVNRIPIGSEYDLMVQIENSGTAPLTISEVTIPFSGASIKNSLPFTIEESASALIQVNFKPESKGLRVGDFEVVTNGVTSGNSTFSINTLFYAINELSLSNASGKSGQLIPIRLNLNSTEGIAAMQTQIELPADFDFVHGSIILNEAWILDHEIDARQNGRILTLVIFSPTNRALPPITDFLVEFDLIAKSGPGYYPLLVLNAMASVPDDELQFSDLYSGSINLTAPIISYPDSKQFSGIVQNEESELSINLRNDGPDVLLIQEVVTDIAGIDLIESLPVSIEPYTNRDLKFRFIPENSGVTQGTIRLNNNSSNNPNAKILVTASVTPPNYLKVRDYTAKSTAAHTLAIDYSFTSTISALQFDLNVDTSVQFDVSAITLTGQVSNSHSISASNISAGKYRVLIYSLSNNQIPSNVESLLEIPFVVNEQGSFPVGFSGVILTGGGGTTIEGVYESGTITIQDQTTVGVQLRQGWNLVGLPVDVEHQNYTELFPGALEQTLNGFNGRYERFDALEKGRGYWVRMGNSSSTDISGNPIESLSLTLNQGWNLMSGLSSQVAVSSIEDLESIIVAGSIYSFSGSYVPSTTIEPGYGYWIRTNLAGTITLDGGTVSKTVQSQPSLALSGFDRIEFLSVSEEKPISTLYLNGSIRSPYSAINFELPPVPPAGNVDVRWEGGLYVSESSKAMALIQQGTNPIQVLIPSTSIDIETGTHAGTVLIREFIGDRLLAEAHIQRQEHYTLSSQTDRIEFELQEKADLPSEFTLDQNYPNPFNPTTTIRFGLPESADVSLEVYTVLGQKVMTLVNENRNAGWHTVSFNGANLSSGVYVYRIQAGGMVQTKKLMLVK